MSKVPEGYRWIRINGKPVLIKNRSNKGTDVIQNKNTKNFEHKDFPGMEFVSDSEAYEYAEEDKKDKQIKNNQKQAIEKEIEERENACRDINTSPYLREKKTKEILKLRAKLKELG